MKNVIVIIKNAWGESPPPKVKTGFIPNLQNSQEVEVAAGEIPLYDAKIMPKDLLTTDYRCFKL